MLKIKNLHAGVDNKKILKGIDLEVAVYSLSDLNRTDFSDDFSDIAEGLD
jgi:hypothetical protein